MWKSLKSGNSHWVVWAFMAFTASAALSSKQGPINLLEFGAGFETGPDGWDVLPYRIFQDPDTAKYPRGWKLVSASADTVKEGGFALALEGSPTLQHHEVRWRTVSLQPNTDYVFSAYVKVESDYNPGGDCQSTGFKLGFSVSNGDRNAIPFSLLRGRSVDVRECWGQIWFQFNTADIEDDQLHPESQYGFRLTFDNTPRAWTDEHDYRILLDAVQLERGIVPSQFIPPWRYECGLDIIPAEDTAPVAERALRYYRLFEEAEAMEFRYWVYARPGQPRPAGVGVRVEDAYLREKDGSPVVFVPRLRLPDPGAGGVGTFEVDHADLAGGSGNYRIVLGGPVEDFSNDLVFGVLRPASSEADVDAEENQFGAQIGNFKYLHRLRNEDGDPDNDLPECADAVAGDPECTLDRLYALGPDPQLPFWLSDRLGLNHVRVKHVFHPSGYAPHDTISGTWDLTQVRWFSETANRFDLKLLAMIGDNFHDLESPISPQVRGYPIWMSPDVFEGRAGWEAFMAGNQRAYTALANELGGLVYAWNVFNEPTSSRNSISIADLIELNQLASDVFGSLDPDSKVVGFGLTGMGPKGVVYARDFPQGRDQLFEEFISAGGLESMDIAAMHLAVTSELAHYPDSLYNVGAAMRLAYCGAANRAELERLIEVHDPGNRNFPYWITETSLLSGSVYDRYNVPNADDVGSEGRRVDPHRLAALITAQHFSNIVAANWRRTYLFNLEASLFVGAHNGPFRALVDVHGSPRPSLLAYYNVRDHLAGARFVERVNADGRRVMLRFERGSREDIMVLYGLDANMRALPFTVDEPVLIFDLWGNRTKKPQLGTEPIFIHGYNVDMYAVAEDIQHQLAVAEVPRLAGQGGKPAPSLVFDRLPSVDPMRWDFECPAHLWLPFEPNPSDLTDRNSEWLERFQDNHRRGFVVSGELSQLYEDYIVGTDTSIHTGETVISGLDLLTRYGGLSEKITGIYGDVEQYLVVRERGAATSNVYLVATSDPSVSNDPRYLITPFDRQVLDEVEKRLDLDTHQVDLVELFTEAGFLISPGTEYLVDLVTWVVGESTALVVDDVQFLAREDFE